LKILNLPGKKTSPTKKRLLKHKKSLKKHTKKQNFEENLIKTFKNSSRQWFFYAL